MKRRTKIAFWVLGLLAALIAEPAWNVAKFAYQVRTFDPDAERAKPPRYTASATIDGFDITFELYLRHPFLAEYTIVGSVTRLGTVLMKEEFIDTGGLSDFYCIKSGSDILITNWNKEGFMIDALRARVKHMDYSRFPEDYELRSFGQFSFAEGEGRTYEYRKKN